MFNNIWHTFFFDPVYNSLVFFIDHLPNGDVGLAIIATVLLVKTILLPISIKAAKTQKIMREIEPQLKAIKEKYKDDRQGQAQAMMGLYKEAGMNPLASIILIFIQIPFIIALYYSIYSGNGIALPNINLDLLYPFVQEPIMITMNFLHTIDITGKSLLLALGAGITQYIFVSLTMPKLAAKKPDDKPDFKDEFMRNMHVQMRYVMPVIITFIAYTISAAVALYFLVSNLVNIGQEFFIRKHR